MDKVYLVPFSHMDLYWLGEREECLSRSNRVIAEALRIAKCDPDFRFLLEDSVFVAHFIACHPERQAELRELVQSGRIEVGPKWAGVFQNLSDGESLVRNLELGLHFTRSTLGVATPAIHLGDLPGYTPQFPQILNRSGIRYAIITRSGPQNTPLFRWRSPDGTEVLAWNALDSYAWARNLSLHKGAPIAIEQGLEAQLRLRMAQAGGRPVLMHWGVDLILPTDNLTAETARAADLSHLQMQVSTPTGFFEALQMDDHVPALAGEIPSAWPFAEPCHLHAVGGDGAAVAALLAAERYTAIAEQLGYSVPSQSALDEGWRLVLEAMDHNNDGQGWVGGARRKAEFHQLAQRVAEDATRRALHALAENVGAFPHPDAHAVVVFNPLAWERTEPVEGHMTFYGNPEAFDAQNFRQTCLIDERGNEIPYQPLEVREGVSREMHFTFVSSTMPSLGYQAYYFVPGQPSTITWPIDAGEYHVAAGRFRLEADPREASFAVYDLEQGKYIVLGIHLIGLEEQDDNYYFKTALTGTCYKPELIDLQLAERGPVRLCWRARIRLAEAAFTLQFRMYNGLERVDLDLDTEWNQDRSLRVLLQFPILGERMRLDYGVPFGAVTYPETMPDTGPFRADEIARDEWFHFREIQGWLCTSGDRGGVSLASSVRAFEIRAPMVSAVLVRGSPSLRTMRLGQGQQGYLRRQPEGPVHASFRLVPWHSQQAAAACHRLGWELAMPPTAIAVADPSSPKSLPPSLSFLQLGSQNLVLTALKRAPGGKLLMRAYEAEGRPVASELCLWRPLAGLQAATIVGDAVSEVQTPLRVQPHEITTWLVRV